MTKHSLHDGGLLEEHVSVVVGAVVVGRLHGHLDLIRVVSEAHEALVHHAEGAGAQLLDELDVLPVHLPLVGLVHCSRPHTRYNKCYWLGRHINTSFWLGKIILTIYFNSLTFPELLIKGLCIRGT